MISEHAMSTHVHHALDEGGYLKHNFRDENPNIDDKGIDNRAHYLSTPEAR
jgi:hypothetical protein